MRSATVGVATAATAAVGLGGATLLEGRHDQRRHGARVVVVRKQSYDGLESTVYDGLRAIGATDFGGKTVLLKPNLVEFDPAAAINTDPRLVAATVLAARRLGAARIVVGEGPDTDATPITWWPSGLYDAAQSGRRERSST